MEREEKAPVAVASNEAFSGWTETFTDPRLCAAIVDRLTFRAIITETGTDSYRLAHPAPRAENLGHLRTRGDAPPQCWRNILNRNGAQAGNVPARS